MRYISIYCNWGVYINTWLHRLQGYSLILMVGPDVCAQMNTSENSTNGQILSFGQFTRKYRPWQIRADVSRANHALRQNGAGSVLRTDQVSRANTDPSKVGKEPYIQRAGTVTCADQASRARFAPSRANHAPN